MPKPQSRAPARVPTPYDELNLVLAHLVEGVQRRLGDKLTGVYLQGSFAVGDSVNKSIRTMPPTRAILEMPSQ